MKYELVIVPPGGGETDYTATINNATSIPRVGDYIILQDKDGLRAFRVLYVTLGAKGTGTPGQYQEETPAVQAEFVEHPYQSKAHTASIEMYEARGKSAHEYPESGY